LALYLLSYFSNNVWGYVLCVRLALRLYEDRVHKDFLHHIDNAA